MHQTPIDRKFRHFGVEAQFLSLSPVDCIQTKLKVKLRVFCFWVGVIQEMVDT